MDHLARTFRVRLLDSPKRPDKAPDLTDKGNEDPNAGRFRSITVHSVGDIDGGDDLVPDGRDGNAKQRGYRPVRRSVIELNEEDNYAHYSHDQAGVAQPESMLGGNGALRDLERGEDACEEKDHGIYRGGNHHTRTGGHCQGLNEIPYFEGSRINPFEGKESVQQRVGGLCSVAADIKGFGAKGEVQQKLNTVRLWRLAFFTKRVRSQTIASVQYIHRYPTRMATKPKIKGASGTPTVTMTAHTPMHRARSFLKKVSATTALPIAAGGLMKKPVMALHNPMVA
ncbi:unnamed protein product [Aspergillus oryzae]|nr:unnamed protein product [Aspergillus oryzae]